MVVRVGQAKRRQILSVEGKQRVVRAIQALPSDSVLTWKQVERIASEHAGRGYKWTRQALERHDEIKAAYLDHEDARKKRLRDGGRRRKGLTESQKVARLEQEVESLRATLNEYDQRFVTYLANAIAHGLTAQQLSAALPPPSRGQGNSDAT